MLRLRAAAGNLKPVFPNHALYLFDPNGRRWKRFSEAWLLPARGAAGSTACAS
jgi:hypothetical protein